MVYFNFVSLKVEPGVVIHSCNSRLKKLRQEDFHEFKPSLGYSVRPCLKTKNQNKQKKQTKPNKQKTTKPKKNLVLATALEVLI